jgi:chromate transport protein ChrA
MSINSKNSKKTILSGLMASSLFGLASTQQNFMFAIFIVSLILSIKLLDKLELIKSVHDLVIGMVLTLIFQMIQTPESDPYMFAFQVLSLKFLLLVLYVWEIVLVLRGPP